VLTWTSASGQRWRRSSPSASWSPSSCGASLAPSPTAGRRDRLVIDALLELTFQLPQSPRRTRILRQLGHELDILNKSA